MADVKFTPGPWVASKFGFQVLTGDSWNSICTLRGSAEWEDKRGSYEPEYEWQNQEANARLIAAAPDLYKAGRRLLEALSNYGHARLPQYVRAEIQDFRTALSKAEGRNDG